MLAAASVAAPMAKLRQNAMLCHSEAAACGRASAAMAASICDHACGGGATGATASAMPPSRSSQNATSDASAGSCASRRSTSRRSSAPSTPSTYSAAIRLPPEAGSMVSSVLMLRDRLSVSTVLDESSSSWCRAERARVARFQFRQTTRQALVLLRHLHALDRSGCRVAHGVGGLDWLHAAAHGACPQTVDRPVARDRHHPGDRAGPAGVKARGLAPHRHKNLLQHVLGFAAVLQDTKADAEKLRRGILINEVQRGAVAARDAYDGGGKLAARGVCVHSVPPDRDPIALPFGANNVAPINASAARRCRTSRPARHPQEIRRCHSSPRASDCAARLLWPCSPNLKEAAHGRAAGCRHATCAVTSRRE